MARNAGSSSSLRILNSDLVNDAANWCLGRPQAVEVTASHTLPGGAPIVRTSDQAWDSAKCRPIRTRLFPGNSQWQVTHDLTYDGFGNVASEKVTGAGMAARTVTTQWGARGQLPVQVTNPLSQATRYAWDEARGQPLAFTDPNGVAVAWAYDAFGQPVRLGDTHLIPHLIERGEQAMEAELPYVRRLMAAAAERSPA